LAKKIHTKLKDKLISYFSKYVDVESKDVIIVSTSNSFNLKSIVSYSNSISSIINISKMNNLRYTNKFLESVNDLLKEGDIYISCVETKELRKKRIFEKNYFFLKNFIYFFDVLFNRVFPKLLFLRKIYFIVTKGRRKVISQAECLGRLVSCGFKILDFKIIDSRMYFVVKKVKEPFFDMNASYGPLFKMKRLGKNGEVFYCYKFRTMHPYSEYLHSYILENYGYSKYGKPANDFRVTSWGKFLRRYWLDELPQLLNVFKGDMNLVGVRPISITYSKDIPQKILELRQKFKPGCIPPYVSLDQSSSKKSVLESEQVYLNRKIKAPFFTDIVFLFYAVYNIIFKRKRSA